MMRRNKEGRQERLEGGKEGGRGTLDWRVERRREERRDQTAFIRSSCLAGPTRVSIIARLTLAALRLFANPDNCHKDAEDADDDVMGAAICLISRKRQT